MRINECSCGCGGSSECGEKELDSYMFFGNLETIKRSIDALLEMDPMMVDQVLNNGHDWAADHIATSKDDIQEVADFFINKMGQGSSSVRMMGMDSRLMDTHAIKTFESFLNEGKKKDQDGDGDNDFADAKIAQYMAGGMSKADAIKKAKRFNKRK
jgi:hypothetical protein